MRNLAYLLTGTLIFTSIILGCRNDKSSSEPTNNQEPHTEETHLLGATNVVSAGESAHLDVETNTHNAVTTRWQLEFNSKDEVTALKYAEDTFTLKHLMITPDENEYPLFISDNGLTGNSINILKLTQRTQSHLIGQVQTVTDATVLQEIRSFINGTENDNVLNSYTDIENSGEIANFQMSFYKASHSVKNKHSLPGQLVARFSNRKDEAHIMIASTEISGNRQVDVSVNILPSDARINQYSLHQHPLHLFFQQPYEDFLNNSSLTALMEGLNMEGLDPLPMAMNKVVESNSITLHFNQNLTIDNKEVELQIEVASDMEPFHFETPFLTLASIEGPAYNVLYNIAAQDAKIKTGLLQWASSLYTEWFSDAPVVESREHLANLREEHNQETKEDIALNNFQSQTSSQNALNEFEERQNMPIIRFAESTTVTPFPEDCDAIYDQEGLSDNYRNCANANAAQETETEN